MPTLTLSGSVDYTGQTLTGIDRFLVRDGAQATFDAAQFGGIGVASDLRLVSGGTAGGAASSITVNGGSIDASGWRYLGWSGSSLALTFNGTSGDDAITGSSRADVINGNGGNDHLSGGFGNDTITGGGGNDIIDGGMGNDSIEIYSHGTGSVAAAGGAGDDMLDAEFDNGGTATLLGGAGNDVIMLMDVTHRVQADISGGAGDDSISIEVDTPITGNGSRFALSGGSGVDGVLLIVDAPGGVHIDLRDGGGGRDIGCNVTLSGFERIFVWAGSADDVIFGGHSTDSIDGGAGNDTIAGGKSHDDLWGRDGKDVFVYFAAVDSFSGNIDVIHDFTPGDDLIDLSAIMPLRAFTFIGSSDFSHTAGELRFEQKDGSTQIYGDINGDGQADLVISCTGAITFQAGDFVL